MKNFSAFQIILRSGLIAGTLDLIAAVIQYLARGGKEPGKIFQFIASGVLGPSAFDGGSKTVAVGVLFHYLFALGWAAFFYWLFISIPFVSKRKYLAGFLYGVFVWLVMNRIVIPYSKVSVGAFKWGQAMISMAIIIVMVGIPISLATHYYSRRVKR